MTLPGSALFAVLVRCLDADVLESIVAPTVADLQFEVQSTTSPWRRRLAFARGYFSVARVLLRHGLMWRSPMRTMLIAVLLGLAGAALLVEMFSRTTLGPAQISPYFLMAMLAPVVMRFVGVNTRRRMFVNCLAVGTVMSVVFLGWFALVKNPSHAPWYAYAPALGLLLGCVTLISGMVAFVATSSDAEDKRDVRGKLINVVVSTGAFAICYTIVGFLRGLPNGRFGVLSMVSWGLFLAFFFVLASIVIYLPIFVSSRRLLPRSRVPLAALGACLFPIPMLAFPLLQGRLEAATQLFVHDPIALATIAVPYVLAGALLGWLSAAPRYEAQRNV